MFVLYKAAIIWFFFFHPQPQSELESLVVLVFGKSTVLESDGLVSILLGARTVMGPSWIVRSVKQNVQKCQMVSFSCTKC